MSNIVWFLILAPFGLFGQSLSLAIGASETKYQYTSFDQNASWDLSSESAFSFSLFYHKPIRKSDFLSVKSGVRYQGMNARGFLVNVPLRYQTTYVSLSSGLEVVPYTYYLNKYCSTCSKMRLVSSLGIELAKIVSGTQTVGNSYAYDLTLEEEFNGLLYGPVVGFGLDIDLFGYTSLLLNYNYTYFFNSHQKPELDNFGRSLISFGIKQQL